MPQSENKKFAMYGPPADYDLLRVWIADRYQVDRAEIAHEYGMEPEPTQFNDDEDDFDGSKKRAAREWITRFNTLRDIDPDRYRRIIAKITLSYADTFLEMAGIKRPYEPIPKEALRGSVFDTSTGVQ